VRQFRKDGVDLRFVDLMEICIGNLHRLFIRFHILIYGIRIPPKCAHVLFFSFVQPIHRFIYTAAQSDTPFFFISDH